MNEPPKWSTSDAKCELARMIQDPKSKLHTTMTFDELHKLEIFSSYKRDNFRRNAGRLYKAITGNDKVWPKTNQRAGERVQKSKSTTEKIPTTKAKKTKTEPWKTSLAKAFVLKLLTDPSRPLKGMSAKEVYDSHSIFQQYPFVRFKDNMKSLAKQVKIDEEWAKVEVEDVERDMELVKRNKLTVRGYPFWNTHRANKLLCEDVKSGKSLLLNGNHDQHNNTNFHIAFLGKANEMKPKDLWKTRNEYKEFPLDVFRGHVHQEKRAQREGPYWQVKRNKKGLKKHNEHTKKLKEEWLNIHGKEQQLLAMMDGLNICD